MGPFRSHGDRSRGSRTDPSKPKGKPSDHLKSVLPLLKELIRPRRGLLALGFLLMVVNRVCGLVLPASTKFLIDNVIGKHQTWLLKPLVLAVLGATVDPGRHLVHAHPVALQGGAAADRGTAPQSAGAHRPPAGGLLRRQQDRRAGLAHHDRRGGRPQPDRHRPGGIRRRHSDGGRSLFVLLCISPLLTGLALLFIARFRLALRKAFKKIRPIFRERGKINAEVTGRLTESLGGVRVVKGYHAEAQEAARVRGRRGAPARQRAAQR